MLDDFFVRALLAGIGVAVIAGPLGCFIIWRRMAYFGDTLSHAALLGVALGLLLEINITLAIFTVATTASLALTVWQRKSTVPQDALLGILSHSALAIALVILAFMTWIRFDITALLFGDVLSVTKLDLAIIYGGGALILFGLVYIWNRLFAATVSYDLSVSEGGDPDKVNLIFTILVASTIAISLKIIGALLITAMLIIPAAAARRLARGPETMALSAAAVGIIAVVAGLFSSLQWDTPSGPSIVVAATLLFFLSLTPIAARFKTFLFRNNIEERP